MKQCTQVCDDFLYLSQCLNKRKTRAGFCLASASHHRRKIANPWEFDFAIWGDDVNLAYVAFTRAKRLLSVPGCILDSLAVLDRVHKWHDEDKEERVKVVAESIPGIPKPLTKVEGGEFYHSRIVPLRQELGVDEDQSLELGTVFDCKSRGVQTGRRRRRRRRTGGIFTNIKRRHVCRMKKMRENVLQCYNKIHKSALLCW